MYQIEYTNRFKKDMKKCQKRGLNMQLIYDAIPEALEAGSKPLEQKRSI